MYTTLGPKVGSRGWGGGVGGGVGGGRGVVLVLEGRFGAGWPARPSSLLMIPGSSM